jgi:hypothetical protein
LVKGRALARPSERSERFEPFVRPYYFLLNRTGYIHTGPVAQPKMKKTGTPAKVTATEPIRSHRTVVVNLNFSFIEK